MSAMLLERTAQLVLLDSALADSLEGRGSVVLVAGEAGIGKSTLIRSFTGQVGRRTRVLLGACDDLMTPRTLGAIRDAFAGRSSRVEQILADGSRDDLLVGVLSELSEPTVLVVEDIHWADDATLDVLRYVSRRVAGTPTVLVISYRDDEVGRDHPAQRLLGGLGGVPVHRLVVPRLTRAGVATLAGRTVATSAALYNATGGNPFYVTEVVASGEDTVPPTVVDAVLSRIHQLAAPVQTALEQLAVVPSRVELPLARTLVGDLTVLAEAERRGVLEVRRDAVAFRHELARRAVEEALPVSERMRAHARVLDTLAAGADPDLSRMLHHAVEAGDDALVVELAPVAAGRAGQAGGFTQEIAYCRLLVEREHLMGPAEIAGTRQQLAAALWVTDDLAESLEHGLAAVAIREELDDVAALGAALIPLGFTQWGLTLTDEALASSARAVGLLGSSPETPTRTWALLTHAVGFTAVGSDVDLVAAAEEAVASARRTAAPEFLALSDVCLGRAQLLSGQTEGGLELMRTGLAATRAANAHLFVLNTYGYLVQDLFDLARFDECQHHVNEGLAYANEREARFHLKYLQAFAHRLQALHGEWDAAIAGLRGIVGTRGGSVKGSLRPALPSLACLLARQGAEDAGAFLAWSRDYARAANCYSDWRWASLVEIEAAWLAGCPADAAEAVARLDRLTDRVGRETARAELNRWKRRLGLPHEVPPGCPEVLAAGIDGDWRAAAAGWEKLDAPYERALELLDSGDTDATLRALEILDELGAKPAARIARRRLRDLGMTQIPRGPRAVTRANLAGLTGRQLEILHLIARGLTDAEIAAELVVSKRTVGHHVSAVLQKLGAPNRSQATLIARELGIDP